MARSLMVGLALFAMLVAVDHVDAGRRRGGCSGGSCGVTYSGCANGSCGVTYSGCANGSCSLSAPAPAAPAPAAASTAAGAAVAVETPKTDVAVEVTAAPTYRTTQVSTRSARGRFFGRRSR